MKKRIVLILFTFVLVLVGTQGTKATVKASETVVAAEDVDFDTLLTEDALIGGSQWQTRGYYLIKGTSIINKQATNKIGAGGITNAYVDCSITVTPIVERLVGGNWVVVTSWTVSKASATTVMASKILTVGTGYSYRVRCLHYAATDASSSWTGALSM